MGQAGEMRRRAFAVAPMDQVQKLDVEWLWPGRIALGCLTVLAGDPDVGKSYLALELAARVSRGAVWPDGQPSLGASKVLLFNGEDHLRCMVQPALEAAGADLTQIESPWLVREGEPGKEFERPVNLKRDLDVLEGMVAKMQQCRLVIFDPISTHLGTGPGGRNAGVGAAGMAVLLRSLMGIAARYQLAIVGVTHLRKGGGEAIHRAVGGLPLTTAARAMWMVVRNNSEVGGRKSEVRRKESGVGGQELGRQESEVRVGRDGAGEAVRGEVWRRGEGRLLLPVKNNLSAERKGLAFRLVTGEGNPVPRVEWSTHEVEKTADEALRELRVKAVADALTLSRAVEFLKGALAGGPRLAKELEIEAKEGSGISYGSLRRGRIALKTRAFRKRVPGPWWVCLREDEQAKAWPTSLCKNAAHLAHVAKNAENLHDFQENGAAHVAHLAEGAGSSNMPEAGVEGQRGKVAEWDALVAELERELEVDQTLLE
jgi:putative DNA primase/helicase